MRIRLNRFSYSVLLYLLTPFILLRLIVRSIKAPAYAARWAERFGLVSRMQNKSQTIWVHAVSVGETIAAIPLIKQLQLRYPHHRLLVTNMTPTGSDRVVATFGDSVSHCYAPYDMPDAVARFLKRTNPQMLVIMETELWPNTIAACEKRQIPVILANARLSEKSALGYRRVLGLTSPMLGRLTKVAAQHSDDGARFIALGLPQANLTITGNIKFDLDITALMRADAEALLKAWRGDSQRKILLVASTHRGEDEIILRAFGEIKHRHPSALLVLVPRHPERFNDVADQAQAAGFVVARHSVREDCLSADVVIGDTMGELMTFYGACDVAFVGGSLVTNGGHNMIEPAAWGKPVLSGPYLFNFAEVSSLLLSSGGMLISRDAQELATTVVELFDHEARLQEMGDQALSVAEANRGALDKLLHIVEQALPAPKR
jgi:3-deoxy-D-manno-octulosonic-acid transferase